MAVHIRLARHGAKKSPFYRIVVTDHRNARDGRFIERLGTFHPDSDALVLNRERLAFWVSQGAATSETLGQVIKKHPAEAAAG